MVRALRVMTVERGLDPRGFALLAFGGAGPLHAAAIADELGITRILVPRASGVLSALGLAAADRRVTRQRSVFLPAEAAAGRRARRRLRGAAARGARDARRTGIRRRGRVRRALPRPVARADGARAGPRAGRRTSRPPSRPTTSRRYGWREPQTPVEIVTVRLTAIDAGPEVALAEADEEHGRAVTGPAVLHLPETTVAVPEGWAGASRRDRHADPASGGRVSTLDPITLQVITGALRAACEEMGAVLVQARALGEHQGAPRLLDGALHAGRRDAHAGRAHPGPPRRDARGGRGGGRRARRRPGAPGSSTTRTRAGRICRTSRWSRRRSTPGARCSGSRPAAHTTPTSAGRRRDRCPRTRTTLADEGVVIPPVGARRTR